MKVVGWSMPVALLSACAVGPNYRPAGPGTLGVPDRYVGDATPQSLADISRWWTAFGDPALTGLITSALQANLDIAQAAARLKQAREGLVQSRALQLPSVSGSGAAGRNVSQPGPDNSSFSTAVDAQWSADLFGGLRRNTQASRAQLEAAGYSLANVRTAVAAEVARNYIDARRLDARIAIAEDTLATQRDNFAIAGFRVQAGLVSSLDSEQARAQLAQTAAAIPLLRQAEAAARYRIAVLTGQAPGAVDTVFARASVIPHAAVVAAAGTPADILRARPDVRAAERNLAAATAQIGVATADLYPALTLTGSIGTQSSAIRTLTDLITGNIFARLATTIFDAGRLRSVVRQRRAQAEEAFAAYIASVLSALEDVENGLAAREAANARTKLLVEQVDAANATAILARSNYRTGLSDFRTLLDAERTLLSARDGLATAQGDRASAVVQLYLALGGGWDVNGTDQDQAR